MQKSLKNYVQNENVQNENVLILFLTTERRQVLSIENASKKQKTKDRSQKTEDRLSITNASKNRRQKTENILFIENA